MLLLIWLCLLINVWASAQEYVSIGCFKDKSRWNDSAISGGHTTYYHDPFENCFSEAQEGGFEYFAVKDDEQCFTNEHAGRTYSKYGESNNCTHGRGGRNAMDVYIVIYGGMEKIWQKLETKGQVCTGISNTHSRSVSSLKECFKACMDKNKTFCMYGYLKSRYCKMADECDDLKIEEEKPEKFIIWGRIANIMVHGRYSNWNEFSSCSESCGNGTKARNRNCDNPRPQYGGRDCATLGKATESKPCDTEVCESVMLKSSGTLDEKSGLSSTFPWEIVLSVVIVVVVLIILVSVFIQRSEAAESTGHPECKEEEMEGLRGAKEENDGEDIALDILTEGGTAVVEISSKPNEE